MRTPTALAPLVVLLLAACGARTPLRIDGAASGGGPSGAGGDGAGASDAGAGTGGAGAHASDCVDAILGTGGKGAVALALAGSDAYWATGDRRIARAPLAGGPEATLVSLDDAATSLAVDGGFVWWTDTTRLQRMPLAGGSVELIANELAQPFALTVRGGEAWWLEYGGGIFSGAVVHRDVDAAIQVLVSGLDVAKALRVDDAHAWFLTQGLTIPNSWLYGVLARVPRSGGALEVMLVGLHDPVSLDVANGKVYWLEQLGASLQLEGTLVAMDVAGAQATTLGQVPDRLVLGLAVDASDAYVTSLSSAPTDAVLSRLALASGAPEPLADLAGVLYGHVALTDDSVVWTTNWIEGEAPETTPSVRRICK